MADKLEQLKHKQAAPFVFQVNDGVDGSAVHTYVLPLNPENYQISHAPRATVTYTQGGSFEDLAGNSLPKISLSGTFGFQGNVALAAPGEGFNVLQLASVTGAVNAVRGLFGAPTKKGPGKTLRNDELTAWDMYQELEGMFLDFYELFGTYTKDGQKVAESSGPTSANDRDLAGNKYYNAGLNQQSSQGTPPKLVFFNMADDQQWYVQINKFEIRRSTQRRMLYQYEIQMTTLGVYTPQAKDIYLAMWWKGYMVTPTDRSRLSKALAAYAFVSQSVSAFRNLLDDINGTVAMIRNSVMALGSSFTSASGEVTNLNRLFTVKGSNKINTPYSTVLATKAKTATALQVALSISGLPHEYVDALRQTQRELFLYEQNQHLFVQSTSTGGTTAATTSSSLPEILTGIAPQDGYVGGTIASNAPENDLFGTDPLAGIGPVVSEKIIFQGETIETIALKAGVPWQHLVAVNDLDYPYVAGSNQDGKNILVPGDSIKITALTSQIPLFQNGQDWATTLYGTDEYLDGDGNCQIGSTGDIKTISGIDNLGMQLRHRLNSLRGDLRHLSHPDYGSNLPTYVGKPDTEIWLKLAFKEAENTFLEDPRVASIKSLQLVQQGDTCSIHAEVVPVNQTSAAQLNIPILF